MRLAWLFLLLPACLEPQVEDEVALERIYGDPNLTAEQLPHVEENPDLAANVALFATDIPYAQAYAAGNLIWYWRVPEPIVDFIVPLYVITGTEEPQPPIIDVLPGDAGYSPWWRVHEVAITDQYAGERIWSREAIDAGVQAGILQAPVPMSLVKTCPIVKQDIEVRVTPEARPEEPKKVRPTWAIYRNQRVSWVVFAASNIEVPVEERRMPIAPFYTLSRINESFPLVELDAQFDLDGDGLLAQSNNIFQFDVGQPGYTPFWYPIKVDTTPDLVSIETSLDPAVVDLTHEDDFVGPVYEVVTSTKVIPPLRPKREELRNCPIQDGFGTL